MRCVAQGIGGLLIVVITIASLLCAPSYCVADLPPGQPNEAHACCSAPEPSESPTPVGESETSGGCGSCPFMSGSVDSKGSSLDLPAAKPAQFVELPQWLLHSEGLGAICSKGNTGLACLYARWHEPPPQSACQARLCVYLM